MSKKKLTWKSSQWLKLEQCEPALDYYPEGPVVTGYANNNDHRRDLVLNANIPKET